MNIAQEQTGGNASANTLTGGVDMFFSWTDACGTVTPLRDALGSVVALTDAFHRRQRRGQAEILTFQQRGHVDF